MLLKILNEKEFHYGFQYKQEWNISASQFNAEKDCGDGLHFTDEEHWVEWIPMGDHFREVIRTSREMVQVGDSKWRAKAIKLGPRREFSDLLKTEEQQLKAVKKDGRVLNFIENPSEKVKLAALCENGCNIQHLDRSNEKEQIVAVKENGWAIEYIKNPSEIVQLTAIVEDIRAYDKITCKPAGIVTTLVGEQAEDDKD